MNKRDLVDAVAARTGGPKTDAAVAVDAVFSAITDAMKKRDKIAISGFGAFEARFVNERMARNPRTGEPIPVPAHYAPKFKPGKGLKDAIS